MCLPVRSGPIKFSNQNRSLSDGSQVRASPVSVREATWYEQGTFFAIDRKNPCVHGLICGKTQLAKRNMRRNAGIPMFPGLSRDQENAVESTCAAASHDVVLK